MTYLDECIKNTEARLAHARQILSAQMREVLQLEDLLEAHLSHRHDVQTEEFLNSLISLKSIS